MMKRLLRLGVICLGGYLVLVVISFALQTRLMFFPGTLPPDYAFVVKPGMEEVFIKTTDGETINGLYYDGTRDDVVLYFHGNAGDLSSWQHIVDDFTSFGFNLLIIDYRGYGKSTGTISEGGFYTDAEAALQFLMTQKNFHESNIIAYGRSIGSGVAVDLCSKHKLKGLMLEAPYASLRQLVVEKVPFLLPKLWLSYSFNSLNKLSHIECPLLIIHGTRDEVIPFHHGKNLYDTYRGKKQIFLIDGGPHNNLNVFPEYFQAITTAATGFF